MCQRQPTVACGDQSWQSVDSRRSDMAPCIVFCEINDDNDDITEVFLPPFLMTVLDTK